MDREARRQALSELVEELQQDQPSTPEELEEARAAFIGRRLDAAFDNFRGAPAIDDAQLRIDVDARTDQNSTPRAMRRTADA